MVNTIIWALAIFIFFLDQASKFLISRNFYLNKPAEVIANVFSITLTHNTGAAFGIFKDHAVFFIVISTVAVIAIIFYLRKKPHPSPARDIALALILGGAFGNLVDRLRLGYVVDFLDFKVWPVFNVADSAITVGVFLLLIRCIPRYSK